jgi:hypothetical protein
MFALLFYLLSMRYIEFGRVPVRRLFIGMAHAINNSPPQRSEARAMRLSLPLETGIILPGEMVMPA